MSEQKVLKEIFERAESESRRGRRRIRNKEKPAGRVRNVQQVKVRFSHLCRLMKFVELGLHQQSRVETVLTAKRMPSDFVLFYPHNLLAFCPPSYSPIYIYVLAWLTHFLYILSHYIIYYALLTLNFKLCILYFTFVAYLFSYFTKIRYRANYCTLRFILIIFKNGNIKKRKTVKKFL